MTEIVAVDIGGTHARFAIAEVAAGRVVRLDEEVTLKAAEHASLQTAWEAFAERLGRATFKTSAVDTERWTIEAPCRIFADQDAVIAAFKAGELDRDVVVVVRFQGPRANGMPELHKLTPPLGVLQDRGYRVALVTDGRMSGASGKVPAAIHLTPEALGGGPLSKLRDGDVVRLSAEAGQLSALVESGAWENRAPADPPPAPLGTGRELFALMRHTADGAEQGASAMLAAMEGVA